MGNKKIKSVWKTDWTMWGGGWNGLDCYISQIFAKDPKGLSWRSQWGFWI